MMLVYHYFCTTPGCHREYHCRVEHVAGEGTVALELDLGVCVYCRQEENR